MDVNELWQKIKDKTKLTYEQFKEIYNLVKKICEENNLDFDSIDFENGFDWTLNFDELKRAVEMSLEYLKKVEEAKETEVKKDYSEAINRAKYLWNRIKDKTKLTYLEFENIVKYVYDICKNSGLDFDSIDIESFDWSLSYYELISEIDKSIGLFKTREFSEDEIEAYEKMATQKEEEYYKQEFEKRIEEIKNSNINELEKYYKNYYEHIEAFLKNQKVNGFFIIGNAGIGKTFNLLKYLKEKGLKFELVKGHYTNLSFYKTLYENRENSILVIDDVITLANDKEKVSLLLGALDDSHMCMWNSTSPLTADLPRSFSFTSKIFILANEFNEKNEFLKALKDRCIYYELSFSKQEIIEMLYILAKSKSYPLEIVDYIKELSENNVIKNLSLRLLDKLYTYYDNPNWKELVQDIIEIDEAENLVYELMKSGKPVKEQVKEFIEKTGLSRRTYFRIKEKIRGKFGAKVPSARGV